MVISALIPTYNRRRDVFRAIDSVIAQTTPVDEIIVVDDGSTDGTSAAIGTHYGQRVSVFRQENTGAAGARNRGLREARGDWIAFLDSDDHWLPTKIERQVESLAKCGTEVGVCFTDCTFNGDPEIRRSAFASSGFEGVAKVGLLEDPAKYILTSLEPFYTPTILVRRSLLAEVGGFDEALFIREDTDLFFRLGFRTKFCYAGEPLVQADRTPSRSLGLCNSYALRDDRVFESWERLYKKWLALPEVAGTGYEQPIIDLLREAYLNSTETKLHQLRIRSALHEIVGLRPLQGSYASIFSTLLRRKMSKVRLKSRISAPVTIE